MPRFRRKSEPGAAPAPVGAWIFVSHSHQDLDEVRAIRNALETKGHNPLLFFLKCLGDDAELDELIRREIRARRFFLLCDSPNARASRYVQDEVRLIRDLPDKVHVTLDVKSDWGTQLDAVEALSRGATIFLSYARNDRQLAGALAASLRERDYRVWDDIESIGPGTRWKEQVDDAIGPGPRVLRRPVAGRG